MKRYVEPVLGVVLVLVGALWTLQGAGVVGGSSMTGSTFWLVIGLIAVAAGVAMVVRGLRAPRVRR